MGFKIVLATATSMALLMASAQAGDSNTLYLEQIGEANQASINQSVGGGGNNIGKVADPVTQKGDRNDFRFSNASNFYGGNNDIEKAEQIGDDNYFSGATWNNASNNVIKDFEQKGNFNRARISVNGPDGGLVDTVRQTGSANHLVIEQSGSYSTGNKILSVTMEGDNNGLGPDSNGDWRRAGTYLYQSGNNNLIQESTIEGNGNIGPAGGSNTYRNTHRIEQRGNDNGNQISRAVTKGSNIGADYNRIWIFQDGDKNNFWVTQGLSEASTGNHAIATQTGDMNWFVGDQRGDHNTIESSQIGDGNISHGFQFGDYNALKTAQTGDDNNINASWSGQSGSYNLAEVIQTGNSNDFYLYQKGVNNTVSASFTGDFNGTGTMSGPAGKLAYEEGHVANSIFMQEGLWNSATLVVTSSRNIFGLSQIGDSNVIHGTIDTGDSNQAAVLQMGNLNHTTFTQSGTGNNVAVSQ